MQFQWKIKPQPSESVTDELAKGINVSSVLAAMLIQRGISNFDEAKAFFRPDLNTLHDPFLMKGMTQAVERIKKSISLKEKILIYGDYDVDGTTSVAMIYDFLAKIYFKECLETYIPDRYKEGYGISTQGIDYAKANGFSLIIALDCGIKSVDKIAYANENGVDFIICDHHNPGTKVPDAVAVLDPKQTDCAYPYKELSGCGVGFKLIQALAQRLDIKEVDIFDSLDFLVTSIAADIVPITGENRILSFYGLKKINTNPRIGIRALMGVAGFKKELTIRNVVFGLAPRINAAGRIHHAKAATDLLLADNEEDAKSFAQNLQETNSSRKDFDVQITAEAIEMIEAQPDFQHLKSTVLFKNDWHKGVVGIVASRCIEKYYKPTIILTESNGKAVGSARSVDGFDVYEAISECADLLEQFGGHTHAAGMTLPIKNVELFRKKFELVVSKHIKPEQLIPKIEVDMEIDTNFVTQKNYNIIKQMQPFGPGNMTPVFVIRKVISDIVNCRIVGDNHLKIKLWKANNSLHKIDAIAFDMAEHLELCSSGKPFDICFSLDENTWNDVTSIQLMIKDIKESVL
jgi:single-stranded-DNA-specific exonuclease